MKNPLEKKKATIQVEGASYEVELPVSKLEGKSVQNTQIEELVHKYIAAAENQALAEQLEQFRKGYSRRWQY